MMLQPCIPGAGNQEEHTIPYMKSQDCIFLQVSDAWQGSSMCAHDKHRNNGDTACLMVYATQREAS